MNAPFSIYYLSYYNLIFFSLPFLPLKLLFSVLCFTFSRSIFCLQLLFLMLHLFLSKRRLFPDFVSQPSCFILPILPTHFSLRHSNNSKRNEFHHTKHNLPLRIIPPFRFGPQDAAWAKRKDPQ